jgi:hypothetical protein
MDWYGYAIIIMGILLFISMILIFLSRFQIKLRFKAFLMRGKSYLLYTELTKAGKISQGVKEVKDGSLTIQKKVYSIKDEHIYLVPDYGITGVILSEKTASSLDPEGQSHLTPTLIDGIIKRVKATALGDSLKIIRLGFIVMGVLGLAIIIQCFMIFRFYTALKTAGIEITF